MVNFALVNTQKPELQAVSATTLDVQEIFYTLQGEGPNSGRRSLFLRLAGCNLACPNCDTDYTSKRQTYEVATLLTVLLNMASEYKTNSIVITGGEPFRQAPALCKLFAHLLKYDFFVQIETNGLVREQDRTIDGMQTLIDFAFIVCSPKVGRIPKWFACCVNAWKYIIDADAGIDPTDRLPNSVLGYDARPARPLNPATSVYVQPQDSRDPEINQRHLEAARDVALNSDYILGVQLHKLVKLP